MYLVEEAYGPNSVVTKFFPIFRTPLEKMAPLVMPGLGELGVKRGVPKMVAENFAYDGVSGAHGPTNGATYGPTNGPVIGAGA